MARRKTKKSKKKPILPVVLLIFFISIISGLGLESKNTNLPGVNSIISDIFTSDSNSNNQDKSTIENKEEKQKTNDYVDSSFKLHFIDVGQADSILLEQNKEFMLIDGGNKEDSSVVVDYLKNKGVKELKYVVATHVHEDHIGGLPEVLKNFPVKNFYIGKRTATTSIYKNLITTAKSVNLSFTVPKVGEKFTLGKAEITIVAPNSSNYEDLNNDSIVVRAVFRNNSFLLTGDAESESEKEILNNGQTIKSDLLKIGHHGSPSSTIDAFLKAVSPKYAVISVGKDNSYNHPSKSTMNRLKAASIPVYRTDEVGTIIATSDGKTITFDKSLGSYAGK